MPNEDQHLDENVQDTTLDETRKSEDLDDLESLFDDETDSKDDVTVTREEYNRLLKGVKKLASQKGRETKEAPKKTEAPKETSTHSSNDDVTELFLESKPEAELVKDELQKIADKLYDGSLLKAWKNETWLHDKAQALSEENIAKTKVQSPSNQIEGEIDFSQIDKMSDSEQGAAIRKMSDKDYARYQEYQRKKSVTPGQITL